MGLPLFGMIDPTGVGELMVELTCSLRDAYLSTVGFARVSPVLLIRSYKSLLYWFMEMDAGMKQLQQTLIESETDAEHLLLARNQLVVNDKLRNGNREALTALRKIARTTKSSVQSPFEKIMEELAGADSRPLVKEICPTCGDHDPVEHTWMILMGSDIFARMPFHAVHTVLEEDQERLDYETKTLQSYVREKSFSLSERGALADMINPGILKSLVTLRDERK